MNQEQRLEQIFLENENQGIAIAITGQWGVGKTYFWNEFLKKTTQKEINKKKNFYYEASRVNCKNIFDCRKYAYISLFGVENLSDLKNVICTKLALNPYSKTDSNKWEVFQLLKNVVSQFRDIKVSQYGVSASARILESLLFLQVRDAIICFDDFERISNKLDIKDVMGLANQLKLEKNCQIILILDEDKAEGENKLKYADYKEKLIDETIKITSVEPLIRANAKDIEEPLIDLMMKFADALEIHNFRFFQKIIKLYEHFRDQLPNKLAYSTKEMVLIRILQGFLIEDFGNAFDIDWNGFTIEKAVYLLDKNITDLESSADKNYKKLYDILPSLYSSDDVWFSQFKNWFEQKDKFDRNILNESINSELFSEGINILSDSKKKLWKDFWNNQIDISFPDSLYNIVEQLIGFEDIENLAFSYEILVKLGASRLAYTLKAKIYQWINKELKNDQLGFIDNYASFRQSKNCFYNYIDKYKQRKLYVGLPSLLETIYKYTIQNSWNPEHERSLEIASKNEWKEVLFDKIPNDPRFQNVNSNLIASKMIRQNMKPMLNPKIKKMIIQVYDDKGKQSVFYKNYMDYLISRLED